MDLDVLIISVLLPFGCNSTFEAVICGP